MSHFVFYFVKMFCLVWFGVQWNVAVCETNDVLTLKFQDAAAQREAVIWLLDTIIKGRSTPNLWWTGANKKKCKANKVGAWGQVLWTPPPTPHQHPLTPFPVISMTPKSKRTALLCQILWQTLGMCSQADYMYREVKKKKGREREIWMCICSNLSHCFFFSVAFCFHSVRWNADIRCEWKHN